jgi:outer membrane protein OmpA-like peptidoglycan-associated protein
MTSNKKAIAAFENAQSSFDLRNYELAIAYLDEAIDKDRGFVDAYLMKFEVYSEMGDYPKAEEALENAVSVNEDYYRNAYYFLGLLEMQQGKYDEAKPHFEKFKTYENLRPEMVERANKEIANCNFAIRAIANPVDFEPQNMGEAINTKNAEYYPSITADGSQFVYTRLVDDARSFGGKNENIYTSSSREGTWFPSIPVQELNTEYNEGAPTISGDGKTMVFTACELHGEYGGERTGFGSCDLFISYKVDGKWQPAVNMGKPVNSKYWETQPSLTADGKTVFFIRGVPGSDRKPKDQDIYYSRMKEDGKWSIPVKISPRVNTPDQEESVFVHPDGSTIYFSSNGHVGMGGLDLFVARRDSGGRWQRPVNLGYPINTHKDENSILVSPNGQLAYFASDREGGFGDLDLYSFDLYQDVRPLPTTFARGKVVDANTGKPVLADFVITDIDERRKNQTFSSDPQTGEFIVAVATDRNYAVTVKSEGYLPHSQTFSLGKSPAGGGYDIDIQLEPLDIGKTVVLENLYFDLDSDVLKNNSTHELSELASFLRTHPDVIIELGGHTDSQGEEEYNLDLSSRRAEAAKRYLTLTEQIREDRIQTKGYGSANPIASNDNEEGRAKNRRTELKIVDF